MEGLAVPFQQLAQGVASIGNLLNYINPFSDNFILKGVLSGLSNIINYINPFSENFFLKTVLEGIGNILSYINPFSDNFLGKKLIELIGNLLKDLFIPKEDLFTPLINKFNEKFPLVYQLGDIFANLFIVDNIEGAIPKWEMTFFGYTFNIIDFSLYNEYKSTLHTIIIAISYLTFIFRLYKRMPAIIGAYTDK